MQYENLLVQEEDGILILTINRPTAMNALNTTTIQELNHFFSQDAPSVLMSAASSLPEQAKRLLLLALISRAFWR